MPEKPLVAHSLAEAYLYLMATPCASCGQGLLKGSDARVVSKREEGVTVTIVATCSACHADTTKWFLLPGGLTGQEEGETAIVNPTDQPSGILDVGQWIMLFRMITEAAARETDKTEARHLGIEAAQCLEEALKFYDDVDSDLPPSEAFFTNVSQSRLREAPDQFSRQRLIDLRSKLPSMAAMRASVSVRKKKRWWRRGK